MAPKKNKIRKRSSTDEDFDSDKTKTDSSGEVGDLLSPSEVVKMRKKAKTSHDSKEERTKERSNETKTKDGTKAKSNRVLERNSKKDTTEKKREQIKAKREKSDKDGDGKESRKSSTKVLKEKEKKHLKKKMKNNDDSDGELLPVPILYPCGICTKEVSDADDAILCEAGCEYWYHRNCTGMTDIAYQLLTNEDNAEWVCDKCIATKSVPLCKLKGE